MSIFDLFRKRSKKQVEENTLIPRQKTTTQTAKNSTISVSEKKYYQPDSYYTEKAHEGTVFEHEVITFEKRKNTCIPSRNGLYVAEILLLEYCSYGTYPAPKNGYPGFWWFKYGIRDVGGMLRGLDELGYIQFKSVKDSVSKLTIAQLKEILTHHNLSTSGKKSDLVERVVSSVSEENLLGQGVEPKYELTDFGKQELEENEYVPYMHKHPYTTTEDDNFGPTFNVWSINIKLGSGDKSNWRDVVDLEEKKRNDYTEHKNKTFMRDLKTVDPEGYKTLKGQDDQLAAIKKAEAKYESDKDFDALLTFWENIWASSGLKFEGSKWHFRLPDLYIKAKRFDDAIVIVQRIKNTKKNYSDKADSYINKIEERKAKAAANK